eukprot:4754523-Amphidinium_carterae.1
MSYPGNDNIAPDGDTCSRSLTAEGAFVMRHFLAEEYLVLAMLAWYGLLPTSYLEAIRIPDARKKEEIDCDHVDGRYLSTIAGIDPAGWWVWHKRGQCRMAAASLETSAVEMFEQHLMIQP